MKLYAAIPLLIVLLDYSKLVSLLGVMLFFYEPIAIMSLELRDSAE
jgi:hypothetical protein